MAPQKVNHSHPAPIHLTGIDPIMARIIEQVGPYDATYRRERFPSPEQVVAMPMARLRRAGLSRAKALYIKGLAADVVAKKVNFHRFPKMEDEAIIAELTQVKGIGQWTAEMFLMFNLG